MWLLLQKFIVVRSEDDSYVVRIKVWNPKYKDLMALKGYSQPKT